MSNSSNNSEGLKLSYEQAEFLLECINFWASKGPMEYVSGDGAVVMNYEEINQLFLDIQSRKF